MRVLYVSHTALVSGAERALLDLLEALPEHISASVACPRGPLAQMVRAIDVEVVELPEISGSFRLDPVQTPRTLLQLLSAGVALRRIIRASRPDVVHANSLRAGLVATAAFTWRSVPVIIHAHDATPGTRSAALVSAALRPTATSLIAISDHVARGLVELGFKQPIHVLMNPMDTERFDPAVRSKAQARAELGIDPEQLLVGIVAQITPWKGQELAIRATARLRESHPSIKLLIVGEAKFTKSGTRFDNAGYLRSLKELVAQLDLADNVEFLGERSDVDTIIRALDVELAPSYEEPFGRTIIEAMALETPVVATDVGGPPEYITDGLDGFLRPPTDAVAWAEAVNTLLADPGLRQQMGRQASANVRSRFDRHQYALKVADAYTAACEPGSR